MYNAMENVCRTCLRIPDKLLALFDDAQLPHKISTISAVEVQPCDNLPSKICEECVKNINLSYNFRKVIRNSDLELRERYAALANEKSNEFCSSQSKPVDVKFENVDIETLIDIEETNLYDENEITEVSVQNKGPKKKTFNYASKDQNSRKRYSFKNMLMYWKKTYECKPCNFTCTELSKWHNHKRTKHYALGVCNICGKSMRADNLHKHIKSHAESPVSCKECGKVFKNTESLRSHSFIHSGPELICDLCGKSYRYRGEYNRHIKRHSLNGVKTVKCPLCEKMFHEKKHIKKHMQTHTGERPYICQYCHKGFSSGYALKTHTRQHTNEKPYICEYCPMAFPQKVSLMTHIKSKHSTTNT